MEHKISIFHMAETDSTNLEVVRRAGEPDPSSMYVAWADYQCAGRGQKGTSWESERGKNLLFSIMLWPDGIEARRQFALSQAMSLAVCGALQQYAPEFKIKWPNDIYYKEQKVSGTIIETTLCGQMVGRCILGVGINVNQQQFISDAPNPVSLSNILGREVDVKSVLDEVLSRFANNCRQLEAGNIASLAQQYKDLLIWKDGIHTYRDEMGEFSAQLVDIEPNGEIVLSDTAGCERRYMFKQVRHIFNTLECE